MLSAAAWAMVSRTMQGTQGARSCVASTSKAVSRLRFSTTCRPRRRPNTSKHINVLSIEGSEATHETYRPRTVGSSTIPEMAQRLVRLLHQSPEVLQRILHAAPGFAGVLAVLGVLFPAHSALWALYCSSLHSDPLPTKVATSLLCAFTGDYVAQCLSNWEKVQAIRQRGEVASSCAFDLPRALRMAFFTAIMGGAVGHAWFQWLDANVLPDAMTSPSAVAIKTAADQLLMSPACTAIFLAYMRVMEGQAHDALASVRCKFKPTIVANYFFWPFAHVVNFCFVPPSQRVLFCSAMSIAWTVILSKKTNDQPLSQVGRVEDTGAGQVSSCVQAIVGNGVERASGVFMITCNRTAMFSSSTSSCPLVGMAPLSRMQSQEICTNNGGFIDAGQRRALKACKKGGLFTSKFSTAHKRIAGGIGRIDA